ncbi:MAG: exosortase-associated EpsI family protein [Caldilineaceae bacterium]
MELDTFSVNDGQSVVVPTKRQWSNYLAILMLLIAIVAVYVPANGLGWRASTSGYRYQTDLDFWRQTGRAREVTAVAPFDLAHNLRDIPLQIGDWKGEDKQETNEEVNILLNPEQYVLRLYQNSKGQYLWLSMIGARSSQAFHPPDVCYDADGWQYDMSSKTTQLNGGGEIYGLYLEAQKQLADQSTLAEHVVYYFYLFPDDRRNLSDGIVLFKLTSGRYGTVEETLEMQADFVRQFFLSAQG